MANQVAVDVEVAWPYIQRRLERYLAGTTLAVSAGGATVEEHALDGPLHSGFLARTQAPWVASDISSAIANHAALPDVHHERSHDILSNSDHTVTGAALDIVGLTTTNTLGILTPSSAPGASSIILKSSVAGELVLPVFISTIGGTTGGAIMQGIVDVDTSYARAFFGHNAQWNGTTNLWTMDAIGANDASGLLLRNSAGAIDFIFHPSTGNTSRAMDHATFTAGTKFTMTSTGRLGILNTAPSYELDVTGTARATTSLTTPLLTTATNVDLVINPAGTGAVQFPNDQKLRTSSFDSAFPIQGWQINEVAGVAGKSALTIGSISADELFIKYFVADETRIRRGQQYWTYSNGIVSRDFTTPSAIAGTVRVYFENSPAITGAIFVNNDWLMFQYIDNSGGGFTSTFVWGQVSSYIDEGNGEQSWLFTLRQGLTSTALRKGTEAIDFGASGAALIQLSVVDVAGSPYIKMRRWTGANPYTPGNHKTYVQLGDLGSIGNSYYTPVGDGIYIASTAGDERFLVADDNGLQIRGASLALYNGANQTVNFSHTGTDIWIGPSSADKRLSWNGSTLSVTGQIVVQSGSSGYANIADKPTNLSGINSSEGTKLAGIAANATVGATWGTNLNSIPTRFGDAPSAAGLYLTPTHLGYYNGSAWKAWIASTGEFYFGGSSGAHLEWSGTKLRGIGTDGTTEQWYANSADGKLYAGAGATWLDSAGLNFNVQAAGATPSYLRFASGATLRGGVGFIYTAGPTPDPTDGMVFYNAQSTKFRFIGATLSEFDHSLSVTGNITVSGTVDGVDVAAFKSAYDSHNHNAAYLALTGGTLTGTVTSRAITPSADNAYDLGSSGARWQDVYAVNLHVGTIVGTPSYAHSHAASDITSGVLDFARIPTTWTGALTLDADSAGTSNYIRWTTQTGVKNWDLTGRAHDYATASQQNDLLLTYYDGSTIHVAFQADSGTRVIDFGQTPTVGGVAVSLTGHTQAHTTLTYSGLTAGHVLRASGATAASFSQLAHSDLSGLTTGDPHTQYLLASGTRASTGLQTFGAGIVANVLSTFNNHNPVLVGNTSNGWWAYSYMDGLGGGAQNAFLRAGGTSGAPTSVLAGMGLGSFSFRGHNGGGFTGSKAYISAQATENWTPTANGTAITFSVTPNGSSTLTTGMVLNHNGNVGIGSAGPSYRLDIIGTMRATGIIYAGGDIEMTGELLAANGTAGAPSIAALSDTNTGLYWPSADTLAVAAGGTAILTVGITGAAIGTALDTGAALKVQSIANDDITIFLKQRAGQTARMLRAENSTGQELIVLDAVGNLQSGNPGFVSGLTGWQITPEGNAEFNNATIRGSLHSSIFVMDEFHASSGTTVFATAGRLLFDSSVGTGDVTLDIEDPVAGHARIFQVGNHLRAKGTGNIAASAAAKLFMSLPGMIEFSVASNQGIHIMDVWLQVKAVTDMTTHWRYTCTLLAGGRGTLPAGTAVIRWGNVGDGLVLATSDLNHAPYIDVFTSGAEPWAGDIQPHVRLGRLTGVGVLSPAHVWGIAGGNNLADATQPYFVASNAGIELYKSSLTLHDDTNPTVQMLPSGDVKFGRNIQVPSLTGFHFEPETGNIYIGNWPTGQYLAWSQGLGTLELKGSLVVERPSVVLWSDIVGRPADDAIYNSFITWNQLSGVPEGLSGDYRDILSVSMPEVTNVTATSLTIPAGTVVKFRGGTYATKTLNSSLIWTSFEAAIVYVYCKSANINDNRILLTSTLSDLGINDVLLGRAIGGASKVTWQPLWGRVYVGDNSIVAGAVLADKIAAGAVTADKIAANAIIASKIAAGAVTADKLSVTTLSAVTTNTGALSVTGKLTFPAVTLGDIDYIQFSNSGTIYGYVGMKITLGPTPQADDGMIFHNSNSTKFRFTGASQAIFEQSVTATGYYTSSDHRLKTNLTPIANVLDKLDAITPYRYQMIDDPRWRLGVVAQDIMDIYPEAVQESDGYYAVDYSALIPILLSAIRELKAEVRQMRQR